MRSQFIEQVQIFMEIQQIKNAGNTTEDKSKYNWLCRKRFTFVWISPTEEFQMWQGLSKITAEEQVQILKELIQWLKANPNADPLKIPGITLTLINGMVIKNVINQTNFTRMASFRNSLRKLSLFSNRVAPAPPLGNPAKPRRSVMFNDIPVIYKISK